MSSKSSNVGCALIAALAVIVVVWGVWFFTGTRVDAGEVGVMYSARAGANTKNGLVINPDGTVKIFKPGRHYVAPMYELYTFPTKPQLALYTQDARVGDLKQADAVRITTSDTASTLFDVGVLYHIDPDKLGTVFANFGKADIRTIQSQHIRRALQDAANDIGPEYDAQTLIAPALEDAGKKLTLNLKKKLESKGITIYRAFFLRPYPDANVQTKINQRVNIMTGTEIAKTHKEQAEIERKTALITANAQAKAREMTATKTHSASLEMMSLEIDEAAIDAWNGRFPDVPSGKGVSVVVGEAAVAVGGN
jgi:regulator of protease activity HflC (stomatin/prohibitin superfamily)